ncbi:MAG: ABC transporter permease [Bryobacterales bacterium]|nr:ABC transporter permease [Bryobacterales bacterium]
MGNLLSDLRFGSRLLLRSPGFTIVAILTLALGIGANTALFTVADAVLLRPLPYPEPGQLAMIWEDASHIGFARNTPAPANFVDWKARTRSFSDVAAARFRQATLTEDGAPELATGSGVTWNFFPLMRVAPHLGRAFTPEEDKPDPRVVILSHGLWVRRYGGDPKVVGRDIRMNGLNVTVVGVMPSNFRFPDATTDYWVPAGFTAKDWSNRGSHYLRVVGRLKPGITIERAQQDMQAIAAQLQQEYPRTNSRLGAVVIPLHEEVTGEVRMGVLVLMAAAASVLLIGCANLANLLLARASGRAREVAVRRALGASRTRLITQLVTESLMLAFVGGVLGVALAYAGVRVLEVMIPPQVMAHMTLAMDRRVLLFAAGVSILTGVLFGLAPAWRSASQSLNEALKLGGKGDVGGRSGSFRNLLVVAEVAVAVVLTVSAGLLIETLRYLQGLKLGFEPNRLLTMRTSFGGQKHSEYKDRESLHQRVIEKVSAIPGVASAAFCTNPPFTATGNTNGIEIEGRAEDLSLDAHYREGTGAYLRTLGVRLLEGRLIDERDTASAPFVAVINETFARRYWPNESPLGKRIRFGRGAKWMSIVGVVRDVRERGLQLEMKLSTYIPTAQSGAQGGGFASYLIVRSHTDPQTVMASVRDAFAAVDRELPVHQVRTMDEIIDRHLASRKNQLTLLVTFSSLALLLAAIGVYGVVAFVVSRRTREIGLRMALGATQGDVLSDVLRRGLTSSLAGIAAGVATAMVLTRFMRSMLIGVSSLDWRPYVFSAAVLLFVTLVACYLPARRASSVDPMAALRNE